MLTKINKNQERVRTHETIDLNDVEHQQRNQGKQYGNDLKDKQTITQILYMETNTVLKEFYTSIFVFHCQEDDWKLWSVDQPTMGHV